MLEKVLSPRQRGVYLVTSVLALLPAVLFALTALQPLNTVPQGEFIKIFVVWALMTAIVLFILASLFFRAYWSGVIFHRTARKWATGLGVVYVGLVGWLFMLAGRHAPETLRDDVWVFGLVLMLYAAVAWVRPGDAIAMGRQQSAIRWPLMWLRA